MNAGPWSSPAAFEAWWKSNVVAFNALSVKDPEEWERIAAAVEAFQMTRNKK